MFIQTEERFTPFKILLHNESGKIRDKVLHILSHIALTLNILGNEIGAVLINARTRTLRVSIWDPNARTVVFLRINY
jgi:hypothetical protein